ncbi:hypothetical protein [Plantibacter sp. YIM 135249]|jgi:hypothetical protein|uniref:hypothetical protein n=1 Tax=Plantibacter sp. YIM 135249 TaxID=3423918 RepID=UPI003D32DC29
MIGFGAEPDGLVCSRAGCRDDAVWRIEWRNPKIHTEDRIKIWLACEEHVDFLSEFLAARSFPVNRRAIADASGTSSTSGAPSAGSAS